MEAFITDGGKLPGLLEMRVQERKIVIFTSKERKGQAERLLKRKIDEQMQLMEGETKEEDLGEVKTGHHVVIKSGGEVGEILQPSESCNLEIEVKKISINKLESSKEAKEKLDFNCNGYQVRAKQLHRVAYGHNQSRVRITVTWSRRRSCGFGKVNCRSIDAAQRISQLIPYSSAFDKKDGKNIRVKNISPTLDNAKFKKSVEESIHTKEDLDEIVDAFVVYEKSNASNLEEEVKGYEKKIRELLKEIPLESLFIFPIKKEQAIYCKASIDCSSFEDAEKVVFYLNGANVIGKLMCCIIDSRYFCKLLLFWLLLRFRRMVWRLVEAWRGGRFDFWQFILSRFLVVDCVLPQVRIYYRTFTAIFIVTSFIYTLDITITPPFTFCHLFRFMNKDRCNHFTHRDAFLFKTAFF